MSRRFKTHQLRTEFLLVLFVERQPVATLTGPVREELMGIGRAWVDAGSRFPSHLFYTAKVDRPFSLCGKWDGVERRKSFRHA